MKKTKNNLSGEILDEDAIAMQIYLTPENDIKIDTGVILDEDGNMLPKQVAMENALSLLRTSLFTLTEEYLNEFPEAGARAMEDAHNADAGNVS